MSKKPRLNINTHTNCFVSTFQLALGIQDVGPTVCTCSSPTSTGFVDSCSEFFSLNFFPSSYDIDLGWANLLTVDQAPFSRKFFLGCGRFRIHNTPFFRNLRIGTISLTVKHSNLLGQFLSYEENEIL